MGIIGVVAALTIPNLNSSTNDMEKVAKVKKVYANLIEAFDRATAVYGPVETWFASDGGDSEKKGKRLVNRLTEFLKVTKGPECDFSKDCCTFTLADGTDITLYDIKYHDFAFDESSDTLSRYYLVTPFKIDIDGNNKGKNEYGYDKFRFSITTGGIVPELDYINRDQDPLTETLDSYGDDSVAYIGAAYWIIQNGNMDYLKCPSELNWSTKTSCK